jgi:hypothetical protein
MKCNPNGRPPVKIEDLERNWDVLPCAYSYARAAENMNSEHDRLYGSHTCQKRDRREK